MHFVGVRGLTTSFYILYDYTTSGHKGTIEYVCNIVMFIYSIHTFLYSIFNYL